MLDYRNHAAAFFDTTNFLIQLQNGWQSTNEPVNQFVSRFIAGLKLDPPGRFSFVNQGVLLALMFFTFNWLYERVRQGNERVLEGVDLSKGEKGSLLFDLHEGIVRWERGKPKKSGRTLGAFVKHIRNALAHSHVEIIEDYFKFEDQHGNADQPHTIIRLHAKQVIAFTLDFYEKITHNN